MPSFGQDQAKRRREQQDLINIERQRRIEQTFYFANKRYDMDEISKSRILGAATLAGFAIGQGAVAGDTLWQGGTDPFAWVAADNSLTVMDAQTCFAFGQAAAAHESLMVFRARALKEAEQIPSDWKNDTYWAA